MITTDTAVLEALASDIYSGYFVIRCTGTNPICSNRLCSRCKYPSPCPLVRQEDHAMYLDALTINYPELFI